MLLPDDLPHDYVLEIARPYLGHFISTPSDWTPLKDLPRIRSRDYDGPDFDYDGSVAVQELPREGRG